MSEGSLEALSRVKIKPKRFRSKRESQDIDDALGKIELKDNYRGYRDDKGKT